MKICVLAWGSIVWDQQNLAVVNGFEASGPVLPVEFCRVSRDGRLTLVIDEARGAPCITYSAISTFDDLEAAIENLQIREGMPSSRGVGFVVPRLNRQSATVLQRHPQALKTIVKWVYIRGFDAAIWAALASNFDEKTRKPFSVKAAIRYLETRDEKTLAAALNYIWQAPSEIKTPVREAVGFRWPQ